MHYLRSVPVLLFLFGACDQSPKSKENGNPFPKGYSLENRIAIKLEKELKEISGIAWYQDEFLAIEDESSAIYRLDKESGKIISKTKFAKNEDIEDILIIGDTAWALRSNGNLYRVVNFEDEAGIETQIFEFPIHESRDFEGLTVDRSGQYLWVFCKVCEWDSDEASVFRFNLETLEFESDPMLKIEKGVLENLVSEKEFARLKIQPSAAAYHPITKEFYLLSSVGQWLMILDESLTPKSIHFLKSSLFPQPEGMTFDQEGNLYISNEGRDGKATILKFIYQP